jgi:hypothetical protein
VREVRRVQRDIRWAIYSGARAVYENADFIENNPLVNAARDALDTARDGVSNAQAAVAQAQTSLDGLQAWLDTLDSCPTCPRPPVPFSIESATFDAALAGFGGNSSVSLELGYQVAGESRTATASFGGSVSDLVQPLVTTVSNALF